LGQRYSFRQRLGYVRVINAEAQHEYTHVLHAVNSRSFDSRGELKCPFAA